MADYFGEFKLGLLATHDNNYFITKKKCPLPKKLLPLKEPLKQLRLYKLQENTTKKELRVSQFIFTKF